VIKADLQNEQTGFFAAAFEETALSYSAKNNKGTWDFLWTFEGRPDEGFVKAALVSVLENLSLAPIVLTTLVIEKLEDKDWLLESYRALPPFEVGSFFIYGSHYTDSKPAGKIPLMIEAATAFGSGEHGTTAACILALEDLKQNGFEPVRILDMGCGSGILAIAAAHLWPASKVEAADNDPECVVVTKRHMNANNKNDICVYQSEGYEKTSPVWDRAPYDLIIANILAGPLMEMAQEQSRALKKDGYIILSGTLLEQADELYASYKPHGMVMMMEFPMGEWMTLVLKKMV
jgi:ribosomal protein L11 methyltransferase